MTEQSDEQRRAAEALAAVHTHQDRARRAARLPWWFSVGGFVLVAVPTAANDFISFGGAQEMAIVILVVLVGLLAARYVLGPSHLWVPPLSRLRGVQARQVTDRRTFVLLVVGGGIAGWAVSRYGISASDSIADTIGLDHYPYTVAGVLAGAFFVILVAVSQLIRPKP